MKKPKVPHITSGFAFVDVKLGRENLRKDIEDKGFAFPCTVTGTLNAVHSGDDGVSREFTLDVTEITLGEPIPDGALRVQLDKRLKKTMPTQIKPVPGAERPGGLPAGVQAHEAPLGPMKSYGKGAGRGPMGSPTRLAGTDIMGRPFAKVAAVKVGDVLIPDRGFTCLQAGVARKVERDSGGLYIECVHEGKHTRHYLDGQIDQAPSGAYYVGLYTDENVKQARAKSKR